MSEDLNLIGQEERRRDTFRRWLTKVWLWADELGRPVAQAAAELVARSGEEDYPLWSMARKKGLIGDGELADELRGKFGLPPQRAQETDWEKQLNYSPVIYVDEKVWDHIYQSLGWVNRDMDVDRPNCLWLWSNAANMIRFQRRRREKTYADIRGSDSGVE